MSLQNRVGQHIHLSCSPRGEPGPAPRWRGLSAAAKARRSPKCPPDAHHRGPEEIEASRLNRPRRRYLPGDPARGVCPQVRAGHRVRRADHQATPTQGPRLLHRVGHPGEQLRARLRLRAGARAGDAAQPGPVPGAAAHPGPRQGHGGDKDAGHRARLRAGGRRLRRPRRHAGERGAHRRFLRPGGAAQEPLPKPPARGHRRGAGRGAHGRGHRRGQRGGGGIPHPAQGRGAARAAARGAADRGPPGAQGGAPGHDGLRQKRDHVPPGALGRRHALLGAALPEGGLGH
mmetsp:Transcript_67338/g.179730  ORF Transcript_67338/g.179730 Transcript_67338/m.179730 type:complete len:288 (+) Transcript_67338:553-1416(+)